MMKSTILFLLVSFVLGSFSATAQVTQETRQKAKKIAPVEDKALVFVYRKSALALAVGLQVDLNKDQMHVFDPKQYYLCALDPGTYEFWGYATAIDGKRIVDGLKLDVEGGQVYYIEVAPVVAFLATDTDLKLMDVKAGSTRLKSCNLVGLNEDAKKILDNIVLAPTK